MSRHFADRLLEAVRVKGAPAAVAIDPVLENLPPSVRDQSPRGAGEIAAILEFSRRVIRLVAPFVPVVKINSAYFECYQAAGIDAYHTLIREAQEAGLLVIGDVKRGDVGHSSEMYARAHLSDAFAARTGGRALPDAVTISGYLGMDGVRPFLEVAREEGKGVFVLVRTSNPSAAAIQDLPLADGRKVHDALADHLAPHAAEPGLIGASGYSCLGAVVATRDRSDAAHLRAALPRSIFLVPGYGAQGGRAEDFAPYFASEGRGALIAAGRSVIFAHDGPAYRSRFGTDWERCVVQATRDFVEALRRFASESQIRTTRHPE